MSLVRSATINLARQPRRSEFQRWLAESGGVFLFAIFIMLILVKVRVEPASSAESLGEEIALNTRGDLIRQLIFIGIFFTSLILFYVKKGVKLPETLSMLQVIAISWIILSCTWSAEPLFAFRRAVFMAIVAFIAAFIIDYLGIEKSLKGIYLALAACIVLSYLSLPLPFGRHPPNELDVALIGNWKGVFYHKNVAGAISATAFMFFSHCFLARRKAIDFLFVVASLLFLLGTKSKTPLGFVFPCLFFGLIYNFLYRYKNGPAIFRSFLLLCAFILIAMFIGFYDEIAATLASPYAFTGRGAIWATALSYVKDHYILGSGYNSFWGPGSYYYATSQFIILIGHAHNGFLEILTTTGIFGLALTVSASVILVLYQLLYSARSNYKLCAWLFSAWLFGILQNLLETQFYNIDKEAWLLLMISVFMTQKQFSVEKAQASRSQ